MFLYADTSALARLYLPDEPEADSLRDLILGPDAEAATSELSDLELARALAAAERARRVESAERGLRLVRAHLGSMVGLVPLVPKTVLPAARRVVLDHRVRTLDAIHLAVALDLREFAGAADMAFVTRDHAQATAAKALGFELV